MIENPVVASVVVARKRKATLQPVKMEDIKIEFVDISMDFPMETTAVPIMEFSSDVNTTTTVLASPPLTPTMEVTIATDDSDIFGAEEDNSEEGSSAKAPRKRRKLDHLSAEEKSQHRKMMNRMSAQSARDRQKALMEQQGTKIKALQQSAETLVRQNKKLKLTNQTLTTENVTLKNENSQLSSLVKDLEAKLQAAHHHDQQLLNNFSGIVKHEVDEDVSVAHDVTFDVVANEDDDSSRILSGSSPSEPAVLRTIPLQKGSLEEPLYHPHHLNYPQQQQLQLSNNNSNTAALLLLLVSYLGILTHQNSCKSLETFLNKFLTETSTGSEKNLSKLKVLLDNWLQTKRINSPNPLQQPAPLIPNLDYLKTEPMSPRPG